MAPEQHKTPAAHVISIMGPYLFSRESVMEAPSITDFATLSSIFLGAQHVLRVKFIIAEVGTINLCIFQIKFGQEIRFFILIRLLANSDRAYGHDT